MHGSVDQEQVNDSSAVMYDDNRIGPRSDPRGTFWDILTATDQVSFECSGAPLCQVGVKFPDTKGGSDGQPVKGGR